MTQGELEKLPIQIQKIFSDLELRIMMDLVERIKINGSLSATANWQISRLQQLGESEENIKSFVREALQVSDKEIERIFSDEIYEQYYKNENAYKTYGTNQISYEENIELQQLVEATKQQIKNEYNNLGNSMGFAIKNPQTGKIQYSPLLDYYRSTLDGAVIDIASGAFSYNAVLKRTINQMTNSGVRYIDYDSGVHNRVDVAARRAVMTGFRQVQGKINEQVAKDLNTDKYEVSWHVGARPTHQPWQGRVYSYQGLVDVCGLGSVGGLHGANCYHDYNAFIPGVSARTYTDAWLDEQNEKENTPKRYGEKEYTTYEALQHQRSMERNMRKSRQDIKLLQEGGAEEQDIILKKARYQSQMQAYVDFSKKMELPQQMDRVYQDGLTGKFTPTKKELEQGEKDLFQMMEKFSK